MTSLLYGVSTPNDAKEEGSMETAEFESERRNPIVEEVGSMAGTPAVPDMRLELVPIPVSNVDRAKAFYEQVGFGNLHDTQVTVTMRVVQLTPPGSSCAIVFGTGMGPITDMAPGSVKGLHLVVDDMAATRAALTERGVELSDVDDMGGVLYSYFNDPDGNMWALQQWPAGYQA
jgi:catechol 2,3-dioxygenase-like lactoylglutathione lyase family enzyme